MTQDELNKIAQDFIKKNIYLTLGTTNGTNPWTTPLYYAVDNNYCFYFCSQLDSLHAQHLTKNPHVSFAIFDSHQKEGTGNGIQGKGKAYVLPDNELDEVFKWYQTTFIEMKKELFMGKSIYRFFKIIPEKFYILDPDTKVDKRFGVYLD